MAIDIDAVQGTLLAAGIVGGVTGSIGFIRAHSKLAEKVEGHQTRIEMTEDTIGTVSRDTKQTAQDVAFLRGKAEQ